MRAAARVAFSVGSFAILGCGGATSGDPPPTTTGVNGTEAPKDPAKTPDTTTGTKEPGNTSNPSREPPSNPTTPTQPTTPTSCEKVISDAFPTPSQYPGTKQNVSSEVTACCEKVLIESLGDFEARWDCCANVDKQNDQKVMMACTPWGPPVPPKMIARKHRTTNRLVA